MGTLIINNFGEWWIKFEQYGEQKRKRWNMYRNGTHIGTAPSKKVAVYRAWHWDEV